MIGVAAPTEPPSGAVGLPGGAATTAVLVDIGVPVSILGWLASQGRRRPGSPIPADSRGRWKETVVFLGCLLPQADTFVVCLRNRLKKGLADYAFAEMLAGEDLPEAAEQYVRERHKSSEARRGWRAWLRWKLFSYRVYSRCYGTEGIAVLAHSQMDAVASMIARSFKLGDDLRHDIAYDRPLNKALSLVLQECDVGDGSDVIHELECLTNYFAMAAMLAELLASRPRIMPELRVRALLDVGTHDFEPWQYPGPVGSNKLGV
jgi:hypothetical protein